MEAENERFAAAMRAERARKNMTCEQLGEAVGIGAQTISNWEKGENVPLFTTAEKIADVLGISLDDLAGRQVVHEGVHNGTGG